MSEVYIVDADAPGEDANGDVDVLEFAVEEVEVEAVVVASVEELLGGVAVVVLGIAQAGEHVGEVDAHDFAAGGGVGDGEHPVVGGILMVEDAGGHEVGVGGLAVSAEGMAVEVGGGGAVGGLPRGVGGIDEGLCLVYGVVPEDAGVAVGDGHGVVVDVHLGGVGYFAQGDVDLLRVAGEGDGVVGGFGVVDGYGFRLDSVPEGVEGLAFVEHGCGRVGRAGAFMVECDGELLHAFPGLGLGADEVGAGAAELFAVALLPGQHDEFVAPGLEVHVHAVEGRTEGRVGAGVALFLLGDVAALFVVDVDGDGADVVAEHVGALEVVVILEGEVEPDGAVVQVVVHHGAGSARDGCRQEAAKAEKPFVYCSFHIAYLFVLFLVFVWCGLRREASGLLRAAAGLVRGGRRGVLLPACAVRTGDVCTSRAGGAPYGLKTGGAAMKTGRRVL